jgi:catechol 2,3-dioxygenase-like lactoylglutathione lyase family enzyme
MSYVALATGSFDSVTRFYGEDLGFPVLEGWDRAHGRGRRFDLGGLRLEILDNARQCRPLALGDPADRIHVVVEVADIEAAHRQLRIAAPEPRPVSWGATLFQVRDPDGVAVTFLQWDYQGSEGP